MYKIVNNKIRVNIPEYIARPACVTPSDHSSKFINVGGSSNTYKYNFFPRTLKELMEQFTAFFIRSDFCGGI